MKTIRFICFVLIILSSDAMVAQHGRDQGRGNRQGRGHHHNKVVVVRRSPYRPTKVVVYHPHWYPKYSYNRRWVFFPRYNLYWDNWRNHYVYWDGGVWVSREQAPALIVNVNLSKERNVELRDDDDDDDDIYKSNTKHQQAYKGD